MAFDCKDFSRVITFPRPFALAFVTLVSTCASAVGQSQTPAEKPKRDPAIMRTSMVWQLPDDRMGIRTAPILLLSRNDVAEELHLTADQRKKTWEKIADLGRKAAELKGRGDNDSMALRRSVDQSQLQWLRAELTPEQLARLTQIDLQWEGPSAILSRPQVGEAMHLTADQRSKIQGILKSDSKTPNVPPSQTRLELTKKVFRELDETQQQAWRSLVGPDFVAVQRTALAK